MPDILIRGTLNLCTTLYVLNIFGMKVQLWSGLVISAKHAQFEQNMYINALNEGWGLKKRKKRSNTVKEALE